MGKDAFEELGTGVFDAYGTVSAGGVRGVIFGFFDEGNRGMFKGFGVVSKPNTGIKEMFERWEVMLY